MSWKGDLKIKLRDQLIQMKFRLNTSQRREAEVALSKCQTFQDYYRVSEKYLGLTQKPVEISALLRFANERSPKTLCEIGTQFGGNLFLMANLLSSVDYVVGVDLYVRNRHKLHYLMPDPKNLRTIHGSSYADNVVKSVQSTLGGKTIDVLFIDGDHSYEGVEKDFLKYRHLVTEGGLIVFHDIVPDYKTRCNKITQGYAGAVPIFWKKLSGAYRSHEFVEDPEQDACGIGVIEYSSSVKFPATYECVPS